jgi:hypothetical protein
MRYSSREYLKIYKMRYWSHLQKLNYPANILSITGKKAGCASFGMQPADQCETNKSFRADNKYFGIGIHLN